MKRLHLRRPHRLLSDAPPAPRAKLRNPLGKWARLHGEHLKNHRPKQYAELLKSGKLDAHLRKVDNQAADLFASYMGAGAGYDAAWDAAAREVLFPPGEDVSP